MRGLGRVLRALGWMVLGGLVTVAAWLAVEYWSKASEDYVWDDDTRAAEVRFLVRSVQPAILADPVYDEREWQVYRASQIAAITSPRAFGAALSNPKIRGTDVLCGHEDKIAWIQDHVHARFDGESEYLVVAVADDQLSESSLCAIADSVADAYQTIFVDQERVTRSAKKDALARTFSALQNELRGLIDELNQLRPVPVETQRERLLNRETIVRTALANAASESSEAEANDAEPASYRKDLEEELAQIDSEFKTLDRPSADEQIRRHEIEQKQQLAAEIANRLERMEIELAADDRVALLERATMRSPTN